MFFNRWLFKHYFSAKVPKKKSLYNKNFTYIVLFSILFTLYLFQIDVNCGFEIGMKLEAVDRMNPSLICVATVTDAVDNRFLVHFDNWDDTYDYWSAIVGCCAFLRCTWELDRVTPPSSCSNKPKPHRLLWRNRTQYFYLSE